MHTLASLTAPAKLVVCCLVVALTAVPSGCASDLTLADAPNLYTDSTEDPFAQVPTKLRTTTVEVVYATDRAVEEDGPALRYGYKRSRTVTFGLSSVRIGDADLSWDELVAASRTRGSSPLPLTVEKNTLRGTQPPFGPLVLADGKWIDNPEEVAHHAAERATLHALLAERLALTPRKELYVYVHGYNNTFDEGAFRIAQIWHYCGRGGVPVLFSWPAGSTGLLQGYTRDRESGEFANPHLKRFLRDLASCPDVEKIHLIAHSRGTDVLATAVRELHIECRGRDAGTRATMKLGQMIMAAPDIDLDVFLERFGADRVGYVPEQLTVYVSPNDKAIGASEWLFGSVRRIGQLAFSDMTTAHSSALKTHPVMSVVDVRAATDQMGHGYFLSSPAALSDVILVLRDGRRPGAASGRPLIDDPKGFWRLDDGYPSPPRPPESTSGDPG